MAAELKFRYQGSERLCLGGEFSLTLKIEGWDASSKSWVYGQDVHLLASLQIQVDEDSGEDGAASPDVSWRFCPGPTPFFGTWDDSAPELEAWFGNDAPALQDNRIELLGLTEHGFLKIRWTANVEDDSDPMEVEGVVQFKGLTCTTPQPQDAVRLLGDLWPDSTCWPQQASEPVDCGPDWPSQRRYWSTVTWNLDHLLGR